MYQQYLYYCSNEAIPSALRYTETPYTRGDDKLKSTAKFTYRQAKAHSPLREFVRATRSENRNPAT